MFRHRINPKSQLYKLGNEHHTAAAMHGHLVSVGLGGPRNERRCHGLKLVSSEKTLPIAKYQF